MIALRYAYVLALAIWLGGIVVLGALVAPATFQVLESAAPDVGRALAGDVFGTIISRFHYAGYATGATLFVTLGAIALLGPRPRHFAIRMLIIAATLAITLYSGVVVGGELEAVQESAGGLPSQLEPDDERRLRFDALHLLSERLMLVNLVGALALVYWETRE